MKKMKINELDEFSLINQLFDLYGELLTEKQRQVIEEYFSYNLSLSEISEELNISRSAVKDSLEHAKNNLLNYEEKIQLLKKIKAIENMDIDLTIKEKILKELK